MPTSTSDVVKNASVTCVVNCIKANSSMSNQKVSSKCITKCGANNKTGKMQGGGVLRYITTS